MTLDTQGLYDYWPAVLGYVRKRMERHDFAAIEDLTADTFVRAIERADLYQERGGSPLGWLTTIAHNIVCDWYRRRQRVVSIDLELVDYERAEIDAGSEQHVAVLDVLDALVLLRPEARHVLWRQAEGVPQQDAGAEIGLGKSAAWRRDREGRAALRAALAWQSDNDA